MDDEIELEVSQEERRVFFVETPAEEEDVVMVNSLTDGCQVRISLEKSESFTAQIPEQERLAAVCRALTPTTAVQENAQETYLRKASPLIGIGSVRRLTLVPLNILGAFLQITMTLILTMKKQTTLHFIYHWNYQNQT